ncbi:putative ribonuclease H-like domain-containing protein [Tanacetum coccineum]
MVNWSDHASRNKTGEVEKVNGMMAGLHANNDTELKHPVITTVKTQTKYFPPTVDITTLADLMLKTQILLLGILEFASIITAMVDLSPAASRNRPAVNSADRPNPADWSKRPATVSAGRPVSVEEMPICLMKSCGNSDAYEQDTHTHSNISLLCNPANKRVQKCKLLELVWGKGNQETMVIPEPHRRIGMAERKNRTLMEAARTMLADSKLPTCFGLRLLARSRLAIFKHSDHLGKFEGKADEGYLVGYAPNSKAYRVYNLTHKRVEETDSQIVRI